jgi:amino acid transporter
VSEEGPVLRGARPGDRRVRIAAHHAPYFRYAGPGQFVARPAASGPVTRWGRLWARIRSVLIGRPLSIHEEIGERLSKKKALAIFSSDPISSSAYATEEILRVVVLAGAGALLLSLPVAAAIALLLFIVSTSYRQIAHAYPSGGGAYAVARTNLPQLAALAAAAALLVDYVMTVAVSVSSASQQVISAVPALAGAGVVIAVVSVLLITVGNLRGIRESGNIFALPTYLFVGSALLMIALGVGRIVLLGEGGTPPEPLPGAPDPLEPIGILLILRAFASGSVALTGTEAIANGVPAFKPPEPRNAAATLTIVAVLLAVLFLGITWVADAFGIVPVDEPVTRTVISQVAALVFGADSIGFYLFQAFTALVLFLAANTSYNAFPRLTAILAKDGYAPRQFAFRGERLAYSVGIVVLSAVAIALLVAFQGDTHALIPLYSVGVFVSFTISQGGMVVHWLRARSDGWRWRLALNGFGCLLTGAVAIVVTVAKAPTSLLVAVVIPILVVGMLFISRQYGSAAAHLAVPPDGPIPYTRRPRRVVVPVAGIDRATIQAVNVGRSIADDIVAVVVTDEPAYGQELRERWLRQVPDVPLVVVESPYRALVGPLMAYLHVLDESWHEGEPTPITFVVIPEYVARSWWERILYNQSARRLRAALLGKPHTVVVNVPYRREEPEPFVASAPGWERPPG